MTAGLLVAERFGQIRKTKAPVDDRSNARRVQPPDHVLLLRPTAHDESLESDLAEAFRYEESNRHFGKICLEF